MNYFASILGELAGTDFAFSAKLAGRTGSKQSKDAILTIKNEMNYLTDWYLYVEGTTMVLHIIILILMSCALKSKFRYEPCQIPNIENYRRIGLDTEKIIGTRVIELNTE